MIPAFTLHLKNPIYERLASIGKYDGKHSCLTCATNAGKVFVHNPNERDEESSHSMQFLNINRKITALCTGNLSSSSLEEEKEGRGDSLMIGTQTNLLVYDVEKNSDLFYKDIPEGVHSLIYGKFSGVPDPLVIVGGNCSIQGFNQDGDEKYWTVAGDAVSAFAFCDLAKEKKNNNTSKVLLTGADDYEIRGFEQEQVVYEVGETNRIIDLTSIQKNMYGYALGNGTVGVYTGKSRAWRVKSKHRPVSITSYDLDGDGENELMIGWDNGKFEARKNGNGDVIYKDLFSTSVASVLTAEYRGNGDGMEELLCCATDGEVRGYVAAAPDHTESLMPCLINSEEEEVNKLSERKAALAIQLKSLENTLQGRKGVGSSSSSFSSTALDVDTQ